MTNYPTQLDEIDQWLADNFGIMPGACNSTENLRHTTARMIAEVLWPNKDHFADDSKKVVDTAQEPQGLDEAAEKWWDSVKLFSNLRGSGINAFKAGAKQMAEHQPVLAGLNYAAPTYLTNTDMEQGEIIEGSMGFEPHIKAPIVMLDTAPSFYDGHSQKVIIQIRRKDD